MNPVVRVRIAIAVFTLVTVTVVAPWASKVHAFQTQQLVSPEGIAFSHIAMPDQESVSIRVAWPSDWAYTGSPAGTPFVAAELLPAGGAGDMSPAEVQQAFEQLQVEGGLNVVADHVQGFLTMRTRDLDAAIELGATVLGEPTLDERWLVRIRDGLAANVAESRLGAGARSGDLLRRMTLGGSGLERFLSLSPPEVVTAVTRKDVQRWYARTLVRTGMTVVVAGGIDADTAGEVVDRLLGGLPAGSAEQDLTASASVPVDDSPRSVVLHDPEVGKSTVALLGRLPSTAEGGELEDILIAMMLGSGDESRLFQALRTTLRASYTAQALLDNQSRALRRLLLYAEVDTAKLSEARSTLLDALDTFVAEGPSDAEFQASKARLDDGLRQMLDSPASTASSLLEAALDGQPATRVPALPAELAAITLADIAERLRSVYPTSAQMQEVIVTPDAEAIDGACVIASIDGLADCDTR